MKRFILIVLIGLMVMLSGKAAFSAVEKSPHDILTHEYPKDDDIYDEKSHCSYCHPAFEDPGTKIWKKMPESLKEFGQITTRCYACHDGVAIVDKNVDASRTAFSSKSHAFFENRLVDGKSLLGVSLDFLEEQPLDCTTCHDVHNNKERPFLVMPINELCMECHLVRRKVGFGKENIGSNHPIGMPLLDAAEGPSPIMADKLFSTAYPLPYPEKEGRKSVGTHWDLGGHLTAGDIGNMECFTCHTVHGDELSQPNYRLLAFDPVRKINDQFCENCHRGTRGDGIESNSVFPNPGGTTEPRTYHPADDDTSNGEGRIVDIKEPKDWPFGSAKGKNVLCSTCHDAHEGLENTPILRKPEGPTFCEECHEEVEGHHQSGATSNPKNNDFATTGLKWSYDTTVEWENGNPLIKLEPDTASTGEVKQNGYGTTYGTKVENKVYCSSCHRAHNAGAGIEKKATPSLIISHTANQLCFLCHYKTNVSFNTVAEMRASHFLGDATRTETYDKPLDELRIFTEEWPETKLKSKFGGDNGLEIICQTCHAINKNNLNNSRFSYDNKVMLIARADENTEWTPTLTKGKKDEEDDYEEPEETEVEENKEIVPSAYLCVGCHGENPGGGGSHPMMQIDGFMPDGSKLDRKIPVPPATYTEKLNMNCHSCHNIHTGKNDGGVFMLKAGEIEGDKDPLAIRPYVDITPLCVICHDK